LSSERLGQIYFKLCSDHLSLEAIPRTRMKVDFIRMRDHPPLEYELVMWTPHFAVLKTKGGVEITLRRDGRMIVRKSESENLARQAAAELIGLVQRDFET